MTSTADALKAREDIAYIADRWGEMRRRLEPGGGNPLAGYITGSADPAAPIDLHISALMAEIDWRVGMHYCHALLDETDDVRGVPTTPEARLRLVAERYGHFVTGDPHTALAFATEADKYREKVRKALEKPEPSRYVGPCPEEGCAGELYTRLRDGGTCPECGTEWDGPTYREWVAEQMEARLMTQSEIVTALTTCGYEVPLNTVKSWVKRKRLVGTEGLYRFAEAKRLAEGRVDKGRMQPA